MKDIEKVIGEVGSIAWHDDECPYANTRVDFANPPSDCICVYVKSAPEKACACPYECASKGGCDCHCHDAWRKKIEPTTDLPIENVHGYASRRSVETAFCSDRAISSYEEGKSELEIDCARCDAKAGQPCVEELPVAPIGRRNVRIVSNGTGEGTQVLIDGKPIDTTAVFFEVGLDRAKATIELHVDSVEIDGTMDVDFTQPMRRVDAESFATASAMLHAESASHPRIRRIVWRPAIGDRVSFVADDGLDVLGKVVGAMTSVVSGVSLTKYDVMIGDGTVLSLPADSLMLVVEAAATLTLPSFQEVVDFAKEAKSQLDLSGRFAALMQERFGVEWDSMDYMLKLEILTELVRLAMEPR